MEYLQDHVSNMVDADKKQDIGDDDDVSLEVYRVIVCSKFLSYHFVCMCLLTSSFSTG